MKKSSRRSRRHRNPQQQTGKEQDAFFTKATDNSISTTAKNAFFQPKLSIGQPGDKYEQEADAMADAVVNQSGTSAIQQKKISSIQRYMTNAEFDERGTNTERIEEDKRIQEKPEVQRMENEEEPIHMMHDKEEAVQTKSKSGGNVASQSLSNKINSTKGNGQKLSQELGFEMGAAFGYNFNNVRIHTDKSAVEMNKGLRAQAFTHGQDVYFNSGKYTPESGEGKRLLAHELTHVVQQGAASQKGFGKSVSKAQPKIQRGLFGKIWKGVKKAGKWVGGKIASGAKAVWKGAKKVGSKVWSGVKWFGKQLWSKIKGIFYRVKRWVVNLPKRLGRLFGHLWKGVKSLKPWSLSWWKSLGKINTWKGFLGWLGEFAIYGAEVLGIGEIYETIMDFIKFNTRSLSSREITIAKTVFGNSIEYQLVRVDEYALLGPSWTGREYVSFHTINGWGSITDATLIHELTHVWQYENMGAMYMPRAIHGQMTGGYGYGGVPGLEAKKGIGMSGFNPEQQGDIMGDYYRIKNGLSPHWGSGTTADLPTYEIYVNEVKSK